MLVKRAQVVVREGEAGRYYYLIENGKAQVTRHVGGVEVSVAELRGGDAFGEEALLSGDARNATVTMKTDGVLLRLRKGDFEELLKEPLLSRIGIEQARRKVADGAVWIDVRYPAEFRHGRIPGAINIPLGEVRGAARLLDKRREYVVYCQTGLRSSAAAFLLAQRGCRAYLLDGGLRGSEAGR
jgi:rhodanese-related sulfurtransferase